MKIIAVLVFLTSACHVNGQSSDSIVKSSRSTVYFQMAFQTIQDNFYRGGSINNEQFFKYGIHTYYFNNIMPAIGIGISKKRQIRSLPFQLSHFLGFQSSSQDYEHSEPINDYIDQHGFLQYDQVYNIWDVQKFFAVYKLSTKFSTNKRVFIGPEMMIEGLISHKITEKDIIQTNWSFEDENGRLKKHSALNIKLGGQIGVSFFDHYQVGINALFGLNRSILLSPIEYFYSQQVGIFLNASLN